MGLFKWYEKHIEKFKWYDVSLFKLSMFFFTLFLVTVWSGFRNFILGFAWYWYFILFVIVTIPLLKKMFET